METTISLSKIKELLPGNVILYYVDYRENLSHKIDLLQQCITENSLDKLYEYLDDYLCECENESLGYYKENLTNELIPVLNLTEDEAYCLVYKTYQEEINNDLFERNKSDAIIDLLKNTGEFSLFIDTGLEIEDGSWQWSRTRQSIWLKKIKKKLKIESNKWDDEIREMISNASYGGHLVVYFYNSIENLFTDNSEIDWKSIHLADPTVAIINTYNGSGFHTRLKGHKFSTVFNRNSLFIDSYFKYNYVREVCGMSQNWCKDSIVKFSFEKIKGRKNSESLLAQEALLDRKYAEIYKNGKCTFGDMDINRHRNTYYINNFPCGTKCHDCGTFWID